uniref:Uncharacterized protein n=1 Tax=Arundo donax TaxID=35708 RepID=A0A0A8Y3G9_ARUDO
MVIFLHNIGKDSKAEHVTTTFYPSDYNPIPSPCNVPNEPGSNIISVKYKH